jgi:hypothetical protein
MHIKFNPNNNSKLEKIEELEQKLPPFPEIINDTDIECKEYVVINGTCLAWDLMWIEDVSVSKWFLSKGTKFPEHAHNEKEIIIVYKGELIIYYEDGCTATGKRGDVIQHKAGRIHWAEAKEDTWMIIVSIPATEDYPLIIVPNLIENE